MLNAEITAVVDTTPAAGWKILKNLSNYKNWNQRTYFKLDDESELKVGAKTTMRVKLFGMWLSVPIEIQTYDETNGLRWVGGIPGIYRGSHYFYFEQQGEQTSFVQGEDFTGLFVPLMWPFLKNELMGLYACVNQDLFAQISKP